MEYKRFAIFAIVIIFMSVGTLGFSLGMLYTQSNLETQIVIDNSNDFSVFELGEIVTTSDEYFESSNNSFTGVIVHINHNEFGNVLTLYNPDTEEAFTINERWIANFAKRNYELISEE